jgi:hypothetical protein
MRGYSLEFAAELPHGASETPEQSSAGDGSLELAAGESKLVKKISRRSGITQPLQSGGAPRVAIRGSSDLTPAVIAVAYPDFVAARAGWRLPKLVLNRVIVRATS